MMSNNKVQSNTSQQEVEQPAGEASPTPEVSTAVNGGAQAPIEPPAKEPAASELMTSQVREPNLLTDQENETDKPTKLVEEQNQS